MSGPTLGLGVTASGIETVEKLNAALLELEARLKALPAAAKSVKDLKTLMAGGGLGAGDSLKALAGEVKEATQKQATALQALAEAIQSGYNKVATETNAGGGKAKRSVAAARRELQEEFEKMLASGAIFSNQGLNLASKMGVSLLPGQKVALDDAKKTWASVEAFNRERTAQAVKAAQTAKAQIDAAWAQRSAGRAAVNKVDKDAAWAQVEQAQAVAAEKALLDRSKGFAALAKAEGEARASARVAAAAAEAKGLEQAERMLDAAEKRTRAARKANAAFLIDLAKKDADYDRALAQRSPGRPAISKEAAWVQVEQAQALAAEKTFLEKGKGFAALVKAEGEIRKAARLDAAKAETEGIKAADALVKAAEIASTANRKFVKQVDERFVRGQGSVAKILQLAKEEADAQAAATTMRQVAGQKATAAILKLAAEQAAARLEADQALRFAGDRAVANILKLARDRAAAEADAQAIETAALQRRNAAFAAQSASSRARTVLGARTQLDAGLPTEQVRSAFGDAALVAAQGTSYRAAYDAVHNSVDKLNGKVDAGVPRWRSMAKVMGEAHSAARGLASGFGAMYLTWGSLAPLLAGAALSQSFVQSIKIGATVRQELETLRVLSNETTADVKKLEDQLISLAQRGPFGPREVAEAMKVLSLAGLNAQQVSAAVGPALNLALTGGVSIEKAAESLVAIGTAFGYSAEQFDRVGDVVAKAAAVSMSSVAGMMESFRAASVVGEMYRVTLVDVATSLALVANMGVRNSAAGTAVRQMYSELTGATRQTREAMKTLGVEITDQTGAVRPLVDIFRDLDRAFTNYQGKAGKGLTGAGERRAMQELTNERGAKTFIADFQAFRKKVEAEGGQMSTKLEEINKQILDSFGFTATAAAQMAATPLNQMKSVVSSFQTSLYKAFTDIEPTILAVSANLRNAFNSPEFAKAVTGLASTVADLTVFLIKHADAIGYLALAYAAGKAAAVGYTLGQIAQRIAQGLLTASTVTQTAATTALVFPTLAATGATTALTAATGALAVAARAGGVALRFLMASLGPIGAILAGLGILWGVYAAKSNSANISEQDGARLRSSAVLDSLKAENERLYQLELQLGKTKDARQAELEVAVRMAKQKRLDDTAQRVAPLTAKVREVETLVANNPQLADVANRTRTPKNSGELSFLAKVDEAAAARRKAADIIEDDRRLSAQEEFETKQIAVRARRLAEADDQRRKAEEAARPKGKSMFGDQGRPLTAGQAAAAVASDLAAVVAVYNKQEQTLKTKHDQERKALDLQNKYKLITAAEYTNAIDDLAQREHDLELANLQKRITDSEPLLAKLRALRKPNPIEKQQTADVEGELEQMKNLLASRQQLALLEKAGRQNIVDRGLDLELEKLEDAVDLALQKVEIDERRAGMTVAEAAADVARLATEGSYLQLLRLKNAEIDAAADSLARLDAQLIEGGGTDAKLLERLNAVQRQLDQRTLELQRIKDAQQTQGDRAAKGALENPENAAPWEKTLRAWKNTRGMMLTMENEFKTGFIDAGEKIWTEFFKTGKASMSSLKDLILDTLAKITYRKIIAEPMERVMDSIWKVIDGAAAGSGGSLGAVVAAVDPAKVANDAALASSTASLSTMTLVGVDPATAAFAQVTASAYGAARAMGTMSVSGGASSGAGFLGEFVDLFTGGGGEADIGNMGAEALIPGFARGGMFNAAADVTKFAKGSSFTNQVFNSPTLFKFQRGGVPALGEMGEAGPEAVMPLVRGADGRLGVMNHAGPQPSPNLMVKIDAGALGGLAAAIAGSLKGMFSGGVAGAEVPKAERFARGAVMAPGSHTSSTTQIERFAKGSSFTNQILNSPTLFKFANGGVSSLGQMGEAGPEAIMPLTRGSDGRLGVANHGGRQQAPVTNITIVGGPSKPEVTRKKNTTGGDDVLVRFKEGIKSEIASDVDNGVGLARSIGGRFGVNTAAGLVR